MYVVARRILPSFKKGDETMFTIFGATGRTGSVVAEELLRRGEKVRVVARDPAKVASLAARGAEFVKGDVLDEPSIAKALAGARGAYLLMPPDLTSQDLLARNAKIAYGFAKAVTAERTPHIVLLSSVGAHEPSGTGPIVTTHVAEKALSAIPGTRATFIRAAYFMENLLAYAAAMKKDGILPVFGGGADVRFPMIATRDIGIVAAEVLASGGPSSPTEIIELQGPTEYSFDDAASTASKIIGREVKTHTLPIDALVPTLTSFGMSVNVAGLYREMTEGLGKGKVRFDGSGRPVRGKTSLEEVLRHGVS
jgi:uncharacterized protein YbjT (DUF2867 family)